MNPAERDHGNQDSDLARVTERIAGAVEQFCSQTAQFRMADLLRFVECRVGPVAPDSAGRILRLLRRAGKINYVVLDRSASLYAIVRPVPTQTSFPEFLQPREEYPD